MKGTLVYEGFIFPIVDMWFERGFLWVQAELHGPLREMKERYAEIRIHGKDGLEAVVAQVSSLEWPQMNRGDRLFIVQGIHLMQGD